MQQDILYNHHLVTKGRQQESLVPKNRVLRFINTSRHGHSSIGGDKKQRIGRG